MAQAQSQKPSSGAGTGRPSFRPSDMVQLGLPSNFWGRIDRAVMCPWDYNGNIPEHILALRLDFVPDEDSGYEPFSQHYSAGSGSLNKYAPSLDGVNPVDLSGDDITEMEGPSLVWIGPANVPESGRFLGKGSNVEHFMVSLIEAGFKEEDMGEDLDVSWLEGLYGYFVRVGQKKREGLKEDAASASKKNGDKTILVCAEYDASKAAQAAKGKTSAKKSATKSMRKDELELSSPVSGAKGAGKASGSIATDLDTQVADTTVSVLRDMDGSGKFTEVRGRVFKSFKGADAAKALKLFNSDDFHSANEERWASEGKDGELTLLEE